LSIIGVVKRKEGGHPREQAVSMTERNPTSNWKETVKTWERLHLKRLEGKIHQKGEEPEAGCKEQPAG